MIYTIMAWKYYPYFKTNYYQIFKLLKPIIKIPMHKLLFFPQCWSGDMVFRDFLLHSCTHKLFYMYILCWGSRTWSVLLRTEILGKALSNSTCHSSRGRLNKLDVDAHKWVLINFGYIEPYIYLRANVKLYTSIILIYSQEATLSESLTTCWVRYINRELGPHQ